MPLFCLHCLDRQDGGAALRAKTRPSHLEWAIGLKDQVRMAGALLAEDGETMIGSVFLIEADSLPAAKALSAQDPYTQAGVFGEIRINEARWSIGDGKPA
ncbi:MAG: YciI family protein [Rhodospirillales bacterium]|tara:strand:- start:371 stop:670 length:300 start_codon:yes stop_codon:yes gene_type:complete